MRPLTVNDVLDGHVALDLERFDPMYWFGEARVRGHQRILGGVTMIANAVSAASTWYQLTLADPEAPWRQRDEA